MKCHQDLLSILLFFLSLITMPTMVVKKIVTLQRNFLWGWGFEWRKIVWIAWDKVCEPQDAGGLGIHNIRLFNMALLGKWIWRLSQTKGGLWKDILESKYGGQRSLKEQRLLNSDSLWWRDLKEV